MSYIHPGCNCYFAHSDRSIPFCGNIQALRKIFLSCQDSVVSLKNSQIKLISVTVAEIKGFTIQGWGKLFWWWWKVVEIMIYRKKKRKTINDQFLINTVVEFFPQFNWLYHVHLINLHSLYSLLCIHLLDKVILKCSWILCRYETYI